jgi:KaiC/GvpD/RAD55 family RecA-like ATPase
MTQIATPAYTMDDALGGVLPGRIHVISGTPGTGKTSACLSFLATAIQRRERAVLLTRDRNTDLRAHALYVGMNLGALVRDGRLAVLRFHPRFCELLSAAASADALLAELCETLERSELQQLAAPGAPLRIAIDPMSPLLPAGDSSGMALDALSGWLDQRSATAMFTWTGDLPYGSDRRLDPLIDRAGIILKLERAGAAGFRAHVVRARHGIANSRPIAFQILPGLGIRSPAGTARSDGHLSELVHDSHVTSVLQQTFGAPASATDLEPPTA